MYGSAPAPQSEATPFAPRSPYAVGKVAGYWFAANYREAYDMFVSNGILFNHESPRRGETFVTRKITRALGRIKCGLQDRLYLGNLDAKRDWGLQATMSGDVVNVANDEPGDYVVATGETYSVRDFLTTAFSADMNWEEYVRIDERYFRPTESMSCSAIRRARNRCWVVAKRRFQIPGWYDDRARFGTGSTRANFGGRGTGIHLMGLQMAKMAADAKIFVAGHSGLVNGAISGAACERLLESDRRWAKQGRFNASVRSRGVL